MEISDKSKLTKEKFYTKAFNNSSSSTKNINNSFKKNKKFIPKTNERRKSEKNNINKIISKYNYIKYRNDQKYINCICDSNSYIGLKKKNIIKINLNYKGNMRPKSKSKNKSQSNYIKNNNNSLLLSDRLKNKTINLLSGFNSENKIQNNHNYINNSENLVFDNIKFDSKRNGLNATSPKTARKNNNDFDLEKNFEYFKELENKIREIQKRIKYAKKSLYSNETNFIINNNNHNNNSNQSSSKNIEQISIPKIGDLIVYNKNNKSHNNSKNNTVKSDSKKSSLSNNFNNENTKNKNEHKKNKNINGSYTILNYNSKYKTHINGKAKNISKKKTSYLPEFFSSYNKKRNIFTEKHLDLPIKTKTNKSKSKNWSKNSINDKTTKNISRKKNSNFHKNYIYNNYMTMTPNSNLKYININLNTNNHKTPNIKKKKNTNIKFDNKTPKMSNSSSCKNLYSLSSSKIFENINNRKLICLRNKNLSNSSSISSISHKDHVILNEIINKKIIKNASICRIGKNRENEIEKINQDNLFKIKYEDLNLSFYGVCDGHGPYGHLVSNFIKTNLPIILYQNLYSNIQKNIIDTNYNSIIIKSLKDSFSQTDYKLRHNSNINIDFSGTTCISILFNNNKIIMANIGDSRAIKGQFLPGNNKWNFQILNKEHKPENKEEYIRITKSNGLIHPYLNEDNEYVGPQRVWIKDKNIPGLAMSRSLGDRIFDSVGVISTPDILCFKHKIIDKFIVIASDGLWMYVSNQEVVDIVGKYYEKLNCDEAIEELYSLAKSRFEENDDFIDDITIIILLLG